MVRHDGEPFDFHDDVDVDVDVDAVHAAELPSIRGRNNCNTQALFGDIESMRHKWLDTSER